MTFIRNTCMFHISVTGYEVSGFFRHPLFSRSYRMDLSNLFDIMTRESGESEVRAPPKLPAGFDNFLSCPECSNRHVFVERSRESIAKCTCIYDWKEITEMFANWCEDRELHVCQPRGGVGDVTYAETIHALEQAPWSRVTDCIYSGKEILSIVTFTKNIVERHLSTINAWE